MKPTLPEPDITPEESFTVGLEDVPYFSAETVQRLIDEAYAAGLEDAAKPTQATEKYGCHCDLEEGMEPDGCVLDYGKPEDCVYARLRGSKDKCEYWKPITIHKDTP